MPASEEQIDIFGGDSIRMVLQERPDWLTQPWDTYHAIISDLAMSGALWQWQAAKEIPHSKKGDEQYSSTTLKGLPPDCVRGLKAFFGTTRIDEAAVLNNYQGSEIMIQVNSSTRGTPEDWGTKTQRRLTVRFDTKGKFSGYTITEEYRNKDGNLDIRMVEYFEDPVNYDFDRQAFGLPAARPDDKRYLDLRISFRKTGSAKSFTHVSSGKTESLEQWERRMMLNYSGGFETTEAYCYFASPFRSPTFFGTEPDFQEPKSPQQIPVFSVPGVGSALLQ